MTKTITVYKCPNCKKWVYLGKDSNCSCGSLLRYNILYGGLIEAAKIDMEKLIDLAISNELLKPVPPQSAVRWET